MTVAYSVWDDYESDPPSVQDMVHEFHEVFDCDIAQDDTARLRLNRYRLIKEEFDELAVEIADSNAQVWRGEGRKQYEKSNRERLLKEMADLVYVLYGTAVAMGMDLDEAVRRVHTSNMSKRTLYGEVLRRGDGKVLKSDQYVPPDLRNVTP
jgi:predicted HAD superfamily Cof-like phosphohydrolase